MGSAPYRTVVTASFPHLPPKSRGVGRVGMWEGNFFQGGKQKHFGRRKRAGGHRTVRNLLQSF
ncbi:MAG: hypothetical protein D6765_11520 [Bacteroidetes bacterium]|nr:MAG: hypothetical protein D6765_11520 [Bacteroidota bacterium]